jgi:predicted RNase H-like nuclease
VKLVGVDGCRVGWLGVSERTQNQLTTEWFRSTAELITAAEDVDIITIDIPIGLSDDGSRIADLEARRLLAPARSSSVFPAPVRAALAAGTWEQACELSTAACGKRLSKQSFAIMHRIREVDKALRGSATLASRVREIHPEVCFYFWNGGRPMAHAKRTPEGVAERRALVEEHFGHVFDQLWGSVPRGVAAEDDLLDALAALWTARRLASGHALTLPAEPPRDRLGLRMEMVA